MAITQAVCTSFKQELLTGTHNFTATTGDTFKIALYTSSASLDASTTATITARGALIYNSSDSNKAVAVLDFGGDKTSTSGTFTIQFPTADASNAILRLA
jgi:hypothetical protein